MFSKEPQQLQQPPRRKCKRGPNAVLREAYEQHRAALEHLDTILDALEINSQDAKLGYACGWTSRQLDRLRLRSAGDKITGLKPEFLAQIFKSFCQRGRRELSARQRSAYVPLFERIREVIQPYIDVELLPVHNYVREPRPLTVRARQNVFVPPSCYDKLMAALLADVFSSNSFTAQQRFVQVALLLVLRLGVTFHGCVRALCMMRVSDIGRDDKGNCDFVIVHRSPKRQRWLRVWLDDVTRCALMSLIVHLARTPRREGLRKRLLRPLDPGTHLATGVTDPPDDKRLDAFVRAMNAALAELCQRAAIPCTSLQQLLPTVRWVLDNRETYPSDVIAVLAGAVPANVMPVKQTSVNWTVLPALPTWGTTVELLEPIFVNLTQSQPNRMRAVETFSSEALEMATSLRTLLRLPTCEKLKRSDLATDFETLACAWLGIDGMDGLCAALQSDTARLVAANMACLATWLAALIRENKAMGTVRTYLSDGLAIIRAFPNVPAWSLGNEQRERISDFDIVAKPKLRRLSAWRKWRSFMATLGLPLADLSHTREPHERAAVEEVMLTPTDLTSLMGYFVMEGDAISHACYELVPLAYWAMLRIQEVLRLRLCDVVLTGTPYVEVRSSKGGKSRRVHLHDMPVEVRAHITSARAQRFEALRAWHRQADMSTLLEQPFVDSDLIPDTSKLEKRFKQALTAIGKPSCTFHDLRKGGANWHYRRGTPVKRIARWLGHATLPVTYLSYLRTVDLCQHSAACAMKYDASVSMHVMAALMDLEPSSYLSQKMNEYRIGEETRMFGVEHCVLLLCNEMQIGVEAKGLKP